MLVRLLLMVLDKLNYRRYFGLIISSYRKHLPLSLSLSSYTKLMKTHKLI